MRRTSVVTPGHLTCEISRRPRWSTFYIGLGINASAVLLLMALDPHLRTNVSPEPVMNSHYVMLVAPTTPPPQISAAPRIPVELKVARIEHPRLAPPPVPIEPPKPKVEVAKIPPPPEKVQPAPEVVARVTPPKPVTPPAPVKQVTTNVFDSEKSNLPVVHESVRKVQTGGFGDPNGLPGQGDPKRETVTAANVGSFDLPGGPGKGNGTDGARGTIGKVRRAGFGDSIAQPVLQARNETVAASGFGNVVAQTKSADVPHAPIKAQIQPVQILFKPRPIYTPEARRMGVQGEVLLDVVFEASGALHINRVVKGLGYGLDDMALEAAKKIQFRPALRDGQPYDYAALVHIRFELAD